MWRGSETRWDEKLKRLRNGKKVIVNIRFDKPILVFSFGRKPDELYHLIIR